MDFLNKYNHKKNFRFIGFKKALELAYKRKLTNLVETGTSRGKKKLLFFNKYNWNDGMSTVIFGEYVFYMNGKLFTCDISNDNIRSAKSFTKQFSENIEYIVDDSLNFLNKFTENIDLLYLDSFDGHDKEIASLHQLKEAKLSIKYLKKESIIFIDDILSKGKYSIDFFINNGFEIYFKSKYQIILVNK